jgi:tellurite resistance protein TerC
MDSSLMWPIFFAVVALLLAFDLGVLRRKSQAMSLKAAVWLTVFYAVLALVFNGFVFVEMGPDAGYKFFMGWVIEKSLSMDNLFVFMLIFTHFAVPPAVQHRVLLWGILGALILRGVMIGLGAALIEEFSFILYLFGAFLLFTGIKMLLAADEEPDVENNRIVDFMRKRMRVTEDYEGAKFFVRRNGVLWATPLFLVLLLIEVSDLIFAVDSIPAIFAITHEPFLVYSSNIFAILGLRAMYFALTAFLHRFEYVKYGLSIILIFIGAKMLINHALGYQLISTEVSLLVIITVLAFSVVLSLLKTRGQKAEATTGWVPGSGSKNDHHE